MKIVVLNNNIECVALPVSQLSRLEAQGNYCHVYWTTNSSMLIRRPLVACEKRLGRSFFRTSRFEIVNLEHVEQVRQTRVQDLIRYVFILKDGTEIMLSRKQSLALRKSRML